MKQLTLFEFGLLEKLEKSVSTMTECRVPIFAPLERVSERSSIVQEFKKNGMIRRIQTPWGRVEIRGRKILCSPHRDLLLCLLAYADERQELISGEIKLFFSQNKIIKAYGSENGSQWLKKILKEIRDTTISLENAKGDSFDFNIISQLLFSKEHESYCVVLTKEYINFFKHELTVNFKVLLPRILEIKSALIKQIIIFFLSHDKIDISFEKLLVAIGYPEVSLRSIQRAKREIFNHLKVLRSMGIDVEKKSWLFKYKKHNSIFFIKDISESKRDEAMGREGNIAKRDKAWFMQWKRETALTYKGKPLCVAVPGFLHDVVISVSHRGYLVSHVGGVAKALDRDSAERIWNWLALNPLAVGALDYPELLYLQRYYQERRVILKNECIKIASWTMHDEGKYLFKGWSEGGQVVQCITPMSLEEIKELQWL